MNIDVEITDTTSDDTVIYYDDFDYEGWHDPERSPRYEVIYTWGEGNYSCDCNRFIFYTLAKTGLVSNKQIQCGGHRFKIKIRERLSQELLFSEVVKKSIIEQLRKF